MKYRVIVTDDIKEGETPKRVRATRQEFPRIDLAKAYADTCAATRNPQIVPAGDEYNELASDMLARFGIEFRSVLVGDDCPTWCDDAVKNNDMDAVNTYPRKTHKHGKHYRCTFSAKGRGHLAVDFWNSYQDEEQNAFHHGSVTHPENQYWDKYRGGKYPVHIRRPRLIPTAYDLITCLEKSEVGTFEDFCGDLGYDTDSRKAEQVYNAVVKQSRQVQKFFTASELSELQEVQ
jgi:hypothetical protein